MSTDTTTESRSMILFAEHESIVPELITREFPQNKENFVRQLWNLYNGKAQLSKIKDIKAAFNGKDMEISPVYLPINQIGQFENMNVPLLFREDGVIKEQLQIVFQYYFPSCEIKEGPTSYELHLDSKSSRRLFYFTRLFKQNEAWEPFLLENFKSAFESAKSADRIITSFETNSSSPFTVLKESVVFEDARLNYDKTILNIPFTTESYFRVLGSNSGLFINFYELLNNLVLFAYDLHFVADFYPQMAKALSAELEKERAEYTVQQEKAVVSFEKELRRRVFPVEKLEHKTAVAFAQKNGITEVMLPFINDELLTSIKGTMFALYNRNHSSASTDWLLLPPTQEPLQLSNMQYHGVQEYITFDKDGWASSNGKAPHIINEENRFSAVLEPAFFQQVLLENYKDSPSIKALENTLLLVEKYPKAFSKMDSSVLSGQRPAAGFNGLDLDFTSWISNEGTLTEKKETNPLEYLSSKTGDKTTIIEVGTVVSYLNENHTDRDFMENGLFAVENISIEKDAASGKNQLFLQLKTLVHKQFVQTAAMTSFKILIDGHYLTPATDAVIVNHSAHDFDSLVWNGGIEALNAYLVKIQSTRRCQRIAGENDFRIIQSGQEETIERRDLSLPQAPTATMPWAPTAYHDEDDDEEYDDDGEYGDDEDDHEEMVYEEPVLEAAAPTPPPFVAVPYSTVGHQYSFLYLEELAKLAIYRGDTISAQADYAGDSDIRPAMEALIQANGGDTFLSSLGIPSQRPFILPIYTQETSRVAGSIILF